MPVILGGVQYFRTAEVCRMAGISKSTLFRWLDDGTMDIAVPVTDVTGVCSMALRWNYSKKKPAVPAR